MLDKQNQEAEALVQVSGHKVPFTVTRLDGPRLTLGLLKNLPLRIEVSPPFLPVAGSSRVFSTRGMNKQQSETTCPSKTTW